ncbi:NUDIX hydrolase [Rhizobium oryziradicis]|uniref:ADP-ribose pyrophosphatase n=1 Tax=Rhizobium oryziradicis TaxID=1867956 RepID=A0A1Q8ZMG1_9HYPH|nr:NUDIX domain-containing protein [Rhizobium oryziradicis]OLP43093.1 ADP-ribose pyrophosphatase [Rhizobium oryziradicis]
MTSLHRPASSAIVRHNGRLLLVKRSKPPAESLFAFPGGRGEDGETPEETALRELFEETGLTGTNPRLFATYVLYPDPGGPDEHHFSLSVFIVDVEDDPMAAAARSDAAELGWYTPRDILTLPAPPSVIDCVERLVKSGEEA